MTLMIIVVLAFRVPVFGYTMPVFLFASSLMFVFFLVRSFLGVLKKKAIDSIYFVSFLFILLGEVHDILLSQSILTGLGNYLMSYVLLIFVFVQAGVLIARWVEAFKTTERLHAENKFINEHLEQLVTERTNELNEKNKELEANVKLKNRLFSIIGHDLKSPVISLQQFTEMMLAEENIKNQRKILIALKQMTGSVIHLIENLIIWGMSQGNQIKSNPVEVNINDIVKNTISVLNENAGWKDISISNQLDPEETGFCDPRLFETSLRNLINNSIKFTENGGRITIRSESIPEENILKVIVEDNGIGIPEDRIRQILSGQKIDSNQGTSHEKGTGLGLALVQDLMKIIGGSLELTSIPGKGTKATLILPISDKKPD